MNLMLVAKRVHACRVPNQPTGPVTPGPAHHEAIVSAGMNESKTAEARFTKNHVDVLVMADAAHNPVNQKVFIIPKLQTSNPGTSVHFVRFRPHKGTGTIEVQTTSGRTNRTQYSDVPMIEKYITMQVATEPSQTDQGFMLLQSQAIQMGGSFEDWKRGDPITLSLSVSESGDLVMYPGLAMEQKGTLTRLVYPIEYRKRLDSIQRNLSPVVFHIDYEQTRKLHIRPDGQSWTPPEHTFGEVVRFLFEVNHISKEHADKIANVRFDKQGNTTVHILLDELFPGITNSAVSTISTVTAVASNHSMQKESR
jgi:hypothetical protein